MELQQSQEKMVEVMNWIANDVHELAENWNVESNGKEGSVPSDPIWNAAIHHEEINMGLLPIVGESAESTPQFFLATPIAGED